MYVTSKGCLIGIWRHLPLSASWFYHIFGPEVVPHLDPCYLPLPWTVVDPVIWVPIAKIDPLTQLAIENLGFQGWIMS